MEELRPIMLQNILKNMSEGIVLVNFDGLVNFANSAALELLGYTPEEFIGKKIAGLFFSDQRNDDFAQTIVDSIYDRNKEHRSVVLYHKGDEVHHLSVSTSYLKEDDEKVGIIMVLSDLSEIMDLRDAVKSMEKIKELNRQLEKRNELISKTFGRFLSDDIVNHLLDTPDGLKLGGKKQKLTILMSDLRGFTAMSERMDAADLISMLNHYLGEMTEAIQDHNGTIIEFIGDGIMAIFGEPDQSPKHAEDAVAAALDMEARMEKINRWNKKRNFPSLEMGIGINTGEVIVGNIGSEKRTKYGVVGSHVNLCGRIESYTVGGQILVSPTTLEFIDCDLEVAKKFTVYPKGANGELELSHVTGIGEPYDIHVTPESSVMRTLDHPAPVRFYKIEGKHETNKAMYGGLVAVARDGAILETTAELEIYDNIRIAAGGRLFAKVLEKTENGYNLQYTSVPTGYAGWLKDAGN